MTTTHLLVPHPNHASLLDGGPLGSRPPVICGDGRGNWYPPLSRAAVDYTTTRRALALWYQNAPVLPGIWLVQAAIQRATNGHNLICIGPYTEADVRDILGLAESLGIGTPVTAEDRP